jgi:hypothetical protein
MDTRCNTNPQNNQESLCRELRDKSPLVRWWLCMKPYEGEAPKNRPSWLRVPSNAEIYRSRGAA